MSKLFQKNFKKLPKSCQIVAKNCQKIVKKLSQKVFKNLCDFRKGTEDGKSRGKSKKVQHRKKSKNRKNPTKIEKITTVEKNGILYMKCRHP
jgi:hypothetical protein